METFEVGNYFEILSVDSKGKFLLIVNNMREKPKEISERKAKEWYKKRYPKSSWEKACKEIDGFLKETR